MNKANAYKFRNLPCSITTDDLLWCVCGNHETFGSGVLEWCYDQADAEYRKNFMERHDGFENLTAMSFKDAFGVV